MTPKVVCFGEVMLRLSPPGHERFFQSPLLQATFGGGEANVAVSLAHFGVSSHYVTRLPANPIGDAALRTLRGEGVHVDHVQRGGSRLGIYFAETGAGPRASTVIYDRAHSAISEIAPGRCRGPTSWPARRGSTGPASRLRWGRTPRRASAKPSTPPGTPARASAWISTSGKSCGPPQQAQATMRPLVEGVDLIIANEEDLQSSLGPEHRRRERHVGHAGRGGVSGGCRGGRAGVPCRTRGHHASRESFGERQRLERGAVRREVRRLASQPALRRAHRGSHRRRRWLCRRPDLRPHAGLAGARRASIWRRGRRLETHSPGRFQPGIS